MATKAGVGTSYHHNPNVAGREAAEQALRNAGVSKPDFVFMFATVGYDQRSVLEAVREATGGACLSGCSGEGTISGDDADESNYSVVVMAISSDELHWTNGIATELSADPRAVGQQVAESLSSDLGADAVGLFVFPDGTTVNFDHFFAGLEGNLSSDRFLPLWGGGAGDNLAMRQTYQYCDDEVVSDGVAYALLSGEAHPASAIGIGYIPIGGERKVTRSQGNVIYEIDGRPALEVLQEYLPDRALAEDWGRYVPTFGLSFRAPSYMKDEEYILRGINSVNMADGSVSLQTEVQEGSSVWFSSRDKEIVFHFECVSRGRLMFRDQE